MQRYTLEINLISDTAFSMGTGVSGYLDSEIQHDASGLPTLSGRAIKGLLVNQCSEILFALPEKNKKDWIESAQRLFGSRGDTLDESCLFIGEAGIAPDLAAFIKTKGNLTRSEVIESLTDIRHQTAINESGAPEDESLRSIRVLISGITLYAPLILTDDLNDREKALLSACALTLRRAGLGRNRGKGKIKVVITDRPLDPGKFADDQQKSIDLTSTWIEVLKKEVIG